MVDVPHLAQGENGSLLFSVVVVTWNGRDLLEECVATVLAQDFPHFELIVVDNGSSDGSADWLEHHWGERVRVIRLDLNRGYAGGNNAGILASVGRYVVLLNNDTSVPPDWLTALAGAVDRHPDAGMFTPKILNYYRRDELDNTGHILYADGLARGHHRLERDDGRFDLEREAFYPSGCAGVYKRSMLSEVGLLDERYFAYCEDEDLGLRARWAGWACWYVPESVVYHKYSASTGAYSAGKAFRVERNRTWTIWKNFPARELLLAPLWTACRYLCHFRAARQNRGAAARSSEQGGMARLATAVIAGNTAALLTAPWLFWERYAVRRPKRISAVEFRRLLRDFRMGVEEAVLKD